MATITGNNRSNEISGTNLADIIRGLGGNDEIEGRGGDDLIFGGLGNDEIDGDAGNDRLYGDDGNDEIDGGAGNDRLYGGAGSDRLDGGAGNDRLLGGAGADVFEFERGEGHDAIGDFEDGLDRIDLDDFNFRNVSQALANADQVGADVVFDFGASGSLTVRNVDLADLGVGDFIL